MNFLERNLKLMKEKLEQMEDDRNKGWDELNEIFLHTHKTYSIMHIVKTEYFDWNLPDRKKTMQGLKMNFFQKYPICLGNFIEFQGRSVFWVRFFCYFGTFGKMEEDLAYTTLLFMRKRKM